jgi:uncharacterized protein YfbU (UPF0304 family)
MENIIESGSKLDLKELQRKFDERLAKETKWSITIWLYKYRFKQWWYNFKKWLILKKL